MCYHFNISFFLNSFSEFFANKITNRFPFCGPCPITCSQHNSRLQLCGICHSSSQSGPVASQHTQNERLPLSLSVLSPTTPFPPNSVSAILASFQDSLASLIMLHSDCLECSTLPNSHDSFSHLLTILIQMSLHSHYPTTSLLYFFPKH